MLKKFMVIASAPCNRERGEKQLIGYGDGDDDFNRLVNSATHSPYFFPDVIEVYDAKGVKRIKLYECASDGTLQEVETA